MYEQDDYSEVMDTTVRQKLINQEEIPLDLTNLDIIEDVPNIGDLPEDQYVLARKSGLGTSDSSVVLNVNPFKTIPELIQDKLTLYVTDEDRETSAKVAVRKGKDLEPLIIDKFSKAFQVETIKPPHQYRHKDYTYLTFNFDGVTNTPEQYIPAEIKVVTYKGEKHYNPTKAIYSDLEGFRALPKDFTETNNSIPTKAELYGIPPYYYTQLQQQILGLNAPYGYLSVLFERTWQMYTFFIQRDNQMISQLILDGYKVWQQIEARRPN